MEVLSDIGKWQMRGSVGSRGLLLGGLLMALVGGGGSGAAYGQSVVGLSRIAKNEVAKASEMFGGLDSWLVKKVDPPVLGYVFQGIKKPARWGSPLEGEVFWEGGVGSPRLTYVEGVCSGDSWLVYYSQMLYGLPERREGVGGTVGLRPLSVWAANISEGGGSAYYGTVAGVGRVKAGTLTGLVRGVDSPKEDGIGEGADVSNMRAIVGGSLTHKSATVMGSNQRGPWKPEVEGWDGCGKWGRSEGLSSIDALLWIGAFTEERNMGVAAGKDKDGAGKSGSTLGEGVREDRRILSLQSLQDVIGGKPEIGIVVGSSGGGTKRLVGKFEPLRGGGSYRGELTTLEELRDLQEKAQRIGDVWGKSSQWVIRDGEVSGSYRRGERGHWLEWGQELLTSKMRVGFYLDFLEREGKGYWELRWEDVN